MSVLRCTVTGDCAAAPRQAVSHEGQFFLESGNVPKACWRGHCRCGCQQAIALPSPLLEQGKGCLRSAQCAVRSDKLHSPCACSGAFALGVLLLLQAPLGLRDRSSNAPCFEVIQRFLGTERVSVALGFLSPQSSRLVPLLVCSLLASRPTIVFPCHSGQRHASVANGCPPEG